MLKQLRQYQNNNAQARKTGGSYTCAIKTSNARRQSPTTRSRIAYHCVRGADVTVMANLINVV